MEKLTKYQLKTLNKIKQTGIYRHPPSCVRTSRGNIRTQQEILFKVMEKYLMFKKWRNTIKSKYFREETTYANGKKPIFYDCPLTGGEIRCAINYGNKHELLTVVNENKRNKSYRLKNNG